MPLITGKQIADGSITNSKLSGKFSAQTPRAVDKDLVTAPGTTVVGDIYILAGIGGTWSGGTINDLAEALDTTGTLWNFVTPTAGFVSWVLDEDAEHRFNGTIWEIHQRVNGLADANVVLGTTSGNLPASIVAGAISNIILGTASATALNTGSSNILIGNGTGVSLTDGAGNILIGNLTATSLTTGLNNVVIGDNATVPAAATSNHLSIGDTIFGDIVSKDVRIGGSGVVGGPERFAVVQDTADTVAAKSVETTGSLGAKSNTFVGTADPTGNGAGAAGDYYRRVNGAASTLYLHNGTDWFIVGPGIIQTDFTDLAVDVTTTATSFVSPSTLLTTTITKRFTASKLIVHFSVGTSNTNNGRQMFFRVVVDGVAKRAVGVDCPNSGLPQSAAIVTSVSGVAIGSRTILIEWYVSANTGQVRPVAAPDAEHASMLVEEILV